MLSVEIKDQSFQEPKSMKTFVRQFFKRHFEKKPTLNVENLKLTFNQLEGVYADSLIETFLDEEVKKAIWDCESLKSLGPDDFNFCFLKEFWEVTKKDLCDFLMEFHQNGKQPRGTNCLFILLIPKKECSQKISEYRPISLIGCMYKVLEKILANRLRKVVHYY